VWLSQRVRPILITDYHKNEAFPLLKYSVNKKNPPAACGFRAIFDKRLRILNQFFTHLLYVSIYAKLQIFIQLSQTLTKLCHIKRD